MPNPEDISDPTTAMNMALVLMAKSFKLNYSTPTNNNQRISSNSCNTQIAHPGMNMGQNRHIQMIGGHGGNQNPGGQNVRNQNGLIVVPGIAPPIANKNANQNGNGNVVAAWAGGNANGNNGNQIRCYNCRGLGHNARHCTVRPRRRDAAYLQTQLLIAQKEKAWIQLQAEEFDLMAAAGDIDKIEDVNANCVLMANLQQALTSGIQIGKAPVYDSDGTSECGTKWGTVDQNPTTAEKYVLILNQVAKFVRDFKSLAKEADNSLDKIKVLVIKNDLLVKTVASQDIMYIVQNKTVVDTFDLHTELDPYNDMQNQIERFQAQLGDLKSKSIDTQCASNTLDHLSQKLEDENVSLEFQDDETNALLKPATSNTVPITRASSVVKNDKVIAPGMFRINLFKTSREEKLMPNKPLRASIRTKPFTVSQPHVIYKKTINSNSNGSSFTRVDNTAKTRRPQPRSNTKNDRVTSMSKSRVDLLKGNRTTNLYTINLHEMAYASPICLIARATSTKSWLWHQRLFHLNFDTINDLARNDLVTSLPKFKYHKEHLCPSYEQGKSKKASHQPKRFPNSKQRLHLLHMDLCGLMRVESINGKRYVLVKVDDYSRYTWVHFLRSKDEAPEVIKTFLKKITVLLQAPVIIVRTGNGIEFKNQVLQEYFDSVGISHQASAVRTPQQNRVMERRNRTLVEAARTMLIFWCAPLFLWAEAIATACYTQNRSIIYRRFNKTPYELINARKPDISFLHVFGAL
ncbi:retrovirus-related pol polyprotein from transposon TNT 1-94 [Tanacetum coccineum]